MPDAPDYARSIVDHFLALRGKGSAVSSADQHCLATWEAQGVPVGVVLEGIDDAWAKRSEPPRSLSECARYVRKAHRRWSDAPDDRDERPSGRGAAKETPPRPEPQPPTEHAPSTSSLAQRVRAEIHRRLQLGPSAPVGAAYRRLLDEVARAAELDGDLTASTAAALDDVAALLTAEALPPDDRAAVDAAVERRVDARRARGRIDDDALGRWRKRVLRDELTRRHGLQSFADVVESAD